MNSFIVSKGMKPIGILVVLTILVGLISDELGVIMAIFTLFVGYLFRNPKRYIFENSQSILSPVDGRVIAIDVVDNKIKIYSQVGVLDTHIVRAPADGEMDIRRFQKGLNLNPMRLKGKVLNEQISYKFISHDNKSLMKLKLISGFFNTAIDNNEGKKVSQGENIGFFLDGIAIITVKNEVDLVVNIGDKITAGQTILYKCEK